MQNKKLAAVLRRMVISAMFLSLAVVINLFTETGIPLFGADGIQLKFGGVFTSFPAFLFGPIYGGVVCAASDIIGCIIKPMGAYVPWFTITAFIAGFIKGGIFMLLRKRSDKGIRIFLIILVVLTAFTGVYSIVSVKKDGVYDGTFASSKNILPIEEIISQKESYSAPTKLAVTYAESNARRASLPEDPAKHSKYTVFELDGEEYIFLTSKFGSGFALTTNLISFSFVLFAFLGAVLLAFLYISEKKFPNGAYSSKIFLSIIVAEVVQTSINTYLLMKLYAGTYQNFSYSLLNFPRVAEGIVMSIILSYFTYVLFQVYDSKIKNKFNL